MTRDGFNEIPTDEYKALYGVYLACLDARLRGEKLPKRVSDAMPDVSKRTLRRAPTSTGVQEIAKEA